MKTILVNLDGVLNTYDGNYIENQIPPIKKDAEKFLEKISKNYRVIIFSTRKPKLILNWLKENNLQKYISDVTNTKLPAFAYIDDRCINFSGNYDEIINKLQNFKPYWKN